MAKGLIRSLVGGLSDYMQQPSQEELLAAQMGQNAQLNPLQQSQMNAQFNAAQNGLPQAGFSGEMSPVVTNNQSPVNPINQPGLMELIARRYEGYQQPQMPQSIQPQAGSMTPAGSGMMGIQPSQNRGLLRMLMGM